MYEQKRDQLVSMRDVTASNIESYFLTIEKQVITFACDRMIVGAMRDFNRAFHAYAGGETADSLAAKKQSVIDYYRRDFSARPFASISSNSAITMCFSSTLNRAMWFTQYLKSWISPPR